MGGSGGVNSCLIWRIKATNRKWHEMIYENNQAIRENDVTVKGGNGYGIR
jgi:hypothetical protein